MTMSLVVLRWMRVTDCFLRTIALRSGRERTMYSTCWFDFMPEVCLFCFNFLVYAPKGSTSKTVCFFHIPGNCPNKALDAEISALEIEEQTASLAGTPEQGLECARVLNYPYSFEFLAILWGKVWKLVCPISQGTGLFNSKPRLLQPQPLTYLLRLDV